MTFFVGRSQAPLLKELCPSSNKKSQISPKNNPSCKTPTNLKVDGCAVQAHAREWLYGPHTSCCPP